MICYYFWKVGWHQMSLSIYSGFATNLWFSLHISLHLLSRVLGTGRTLELNRPSCSLLTGLGSARVLPTDNWVWNSLKSFNRLFTYARVSWQWSVVKIVFVSSPFDWRIVVHFFIPFLADLRLFIFYSFGRWDDFIEHCQALARLIH